MEIEIKNTKLSDFICIKNKQQQEIIELKNIIKHQQELMKNSNAKIEEFETSNSWKITKPFRRIITVLKYKRK